MTDAPFVLAAYAVVLGGLVGYAWAVRRRLSAVRGLVAAVERERDRHQPELGSTPDRQSSDTTEVLP